jgi:hypothetical protein
VTARCTMVIEQDSWHLNDTVIVRGCRIDVIPYCIEG